MVQKEKKEESDMINVRFALGIVVEALDLEGLVEALGLVGIDAEPLPLRRLVAGNHLRFISVPPINSF